SHNLTLSVDDAIRYDVDDDEIKSSSTKITCDSNDNNVVRSILEFLPDEILLDIISFLKPYDIYHSLYK
ncbi:unnamed protein product, partial [Rotaria sordida]